MNKIGWIVSAILALCIIYLLTKSDEKHTDLKIDQVAQDSTFVLYSLKYEDEKPVLIGFLENGQIKILSNYFNGYEQVLNFHDNGLLAVKTLYDSLDRVQIGRYYFFESNGNLSNKYNYLDDKKVGVAKSYFPDVHYLKEYMEYDSLGNMYYRRTYDKLGNTVNEEGK